MAKIIRVVTYLVANDDVDEQEAAAAARQLLNSTMDCVAHSYADSATISDDPHYFFSDEFDNSPLNLFDCPESACKAYFEGGKQ